MKKIALTLAGFDPSGGAGLQADLKTFHQHQVYGMSVITLLTIQNTKGVSEVQPMRGADILKQLETVLKDITPHAAKIGALGNAEIITAIKPFVDNFSFPLVIDPVLLSSSGKALLDPAAYETFIGAMIPRAFLLTPNIPEAEALCGFKIPSVTAMEKAAKKIAGMGAKAVLIKGGHLESEKATDLLLFEGQVKRYESARIDTANTHGTGCTFSAAVTARLALGSDLPTAIGEAKQFITNAIENSLSIGGGTGPVNHHAAL